MDSICIQLLELSFNVCYFLIVFSISMHRVRLSV